MSWKSEIKDIDFLEKMSIKNQIQASLSDGQL